MNLHIDGIIFSLQKHGGITVYFRELLKHLINTDVLGQLSVELPVDQTLPNPSAQIRVDSRKARALERFRSCIISTNTSVFHSSYYRMPNRRDVPTVVTVHDFTYERFRTGPAKWVHVLQKHAAIRQAQAVICISESTRDDLLEFVGIRAGQTLHVIPNGVGSLFRPLGLKSAHRPYMLFVGDRRGYKNFKLVLGALERLPDFELHCVGGGEFLDGEFSGFNSALRERVRHLGFVTDEALNVAYNKAVCLVYPSRYEGFGIPVVEAMKAGCPVVSVNCKAVVEVGAEALELLEDEDPVVLAEAIERLLEPSYRERLISAGLQRAEVYDWKSCHNETLEIYRSLASI